MKNSFIVEDNAIEIILPEKINYNSSDFFAQLLPNILNKKLDFVILNFRNTKFVTLPGMLYLLSFCHYVKENINHYLQAEVTEINEKVNFFFKRFNFYTQMSLKANLVTDKETIEMENIYQKNIYKSESIIFPIKNIFRNVRKEYYDSFMNEFLNRFGIFFSTVILNRKFNFDDTEDEFQELFDALNENIKNICDHSKSEGFGAVHASIAQKGTTIAFFDVGVGIASSVIKGREDISFSNEIEAVEWAYKDGHSSKGTKTNQGTGFTILTTFADEKGAILTIRTTSYQCIYKKGKWNIEKKNWFPGTQIVIYIPTLPS
jgi:hypothetical protein